MLTTIQNVLGVTADVRAMGGPTAVLFFVLWLAMIALWLATIRYFWKREQFMATRLDAVNRQMIAILSNGDFDEAS